MSHAREADKPHDFELPRGADERVIPIPPCAVCGQHRGGAIHGEPATVAASLPGKEA